MGDPTPGRWDFPQVRPPLTDIQACGNTAVNLEFKTDAIPISDRDFDFLCRLIYEQSRIRLGPDKRTLVASRLAKRLRSCNWPIIMTIANCSVPPAGGEDSVSD